MKKLKYGEKTVVMRVPKSLVPKVRELLQSAEVLSVTGKTSRKSHSPIGDVLDAFPVPLIQEGLRKAYRRGFCAGEESVIADALEASGMSSKIVPVMRAFRERSANPPGPEFVQAFLHIRQDWYKLTGSRGVDNSYFFPVSVDKIQE